MLTYLRLRSPVPAVRGRVLAHRSLSHAGGLVPTSLRDHQVDDRS
jgi:hypothetical protein